MNYFAIEANDLTKSYPPDVRALDGLSLAVRSGTIFGLLGPNGAGKSTTVRILTTLSRPDGGSARVAGIDVLAEPVRVRHAIGVVGQKHGLDPEATGRENLVLQGELYGITGRELRRRAADALERFGLADAADRQAKTYSGGMQRRLDVAMGLIHRPQVLFLDEPTTGLDPEARADMWGEIERLARDEQMTILLTTHYLDEADRLASQLAIVDRGRIVAEGTPDELKATIGRPTVEAVPADESQREAVADLLRRFGNPTDGDALSVAVRCEQEADLADIIRALDSAGLHVARIQMHEPTLDDVFLAKTGTSLEGAAEEEEAEAEAQEEQEEERNKDKVGDIPQPPNKRCCRLRSK